MKTRTLFPDTVKFVSQSPVRQTQSVINISTQPKINVEEEDFNYEYTQFTMDLPISEEVKNNLKYLFDLFSQVCSQGGLVHVICSNKMNDVMDNMKTKYPEITSFTPEQIFQHYIKYSLFSFEIVLKTGRKVESQKLANLLMPKFIKAESVKKGQTESSNEIKILDEDMVIVTQVISYFNFKQEIFEVNKFLQTYPSEIIKVIAQQPDLVPNLSDKNTHQDIANTHHLCFSSKLGFARLQGFNVMEGKLSDLQTNQSYEITMKQYLTYFHNNSGNRQVSHSSNQGSLSKSSHNKVIFGYQFDPKDELFNRQFYTQLSQTQICYKQLNNIFLYADEDIPGVTLPNFAFHVRGSWIGGHQQLMTKVDINLGPDLVQWFCIAPENVEKFYAILGKEYGIAHDKIQGQWIEDIDWFIQRNIQIKKGFQNKGDCIVIGSGTLCWAKSHGKSLHSFWNIMGKSEKQIKHITSRQKSRVVQQGKRNPFSQNQIPIKSILMRALNHEQQIIPLPRTEQPPVSTHSQQAKISINSIAIIRQSLKKWYIEQEKQLNIMAVKQQLSNSKYKHYSLYNAQSFCMGCEGQILNYFMNNNGKLNCLECALKMMSNKKSVEMADKSVYYKYDPYWLYQLIYYGNLRFAGQNGLFANEFEELCNGEFIDKNEHCLKICLGKDTNTQIKKEQWQKLFIKYVLQEQRINFDTKNHRKMVAVIESKIMESTENAIQVVPLQPVENLEISNSFSFIINGSSNKPFTTLEEMNEIGRRVKREQESWQSKQRDGRDKNNYQHQKTSKVVRNSRFDEGTDDDNTAVSYQGRRQNRYEDRSSSKYKVKREESWDKDDDYRKSEQRRSSNMRSNYMNPEKKVKVDRSHHRARDEHRRQDKPKHYNNERGESYDRKRSQNRDRRRDQHYGRNGRNDEYLKSKVKIEESHKSREYEYKRDRY